MTRGLMKRFSHSRDVALCRAFTTLVVMVCLLLANTATIAQVGLTGESPAQDTVPELPRPLTPEAISELVSRLDDSQVRALLLEQLHYVASQQVQADDSDKPGLVTLVTGMVSGVANNVVVSVERVPQLLRGVQQGIDNWVAGRSAAELGKVFGQLALIILVALLAEIVTRRLTRRFRGDIEERRSRSLFETVRVLGMRLFLEVIGVIVFVCTSVILIRHLIEAPGDQRLFISFIIKVVFFVRLIVASTRFSAAPKRPMLRLLALDDYWAGWMMRHTAGIALLMGVLSFIIPALTDNGVPMGQLRLGFWLNLAVYVYLVWAFWTAREAITGIILGGQDDLSDGERRFARWWPFIAIGLIVCNWLLIEVIVSMKLFQMLKGQQNLTVILIAFAPVFDTAIRGLVNHLMPSMSGQGVVAERAWRETKRSYVRIGRVVLVSGFVLLITGLWGIDLRNLASAGLGAQVAGRVVEALLLLAVGYLVWEFVSTRVNRRLAREHTAAGIDPDSDEPGGGEGGGAGLSRLATVLPLVLRVLQAAVIVITTLLVLGQLGIDTTPLLAGAGIVGLAIGFGAQTFVRDVVSGLFFLFDDAFRVGEFVNIEETQGTVEKISIRSLQLRHHLGSIHTIPYGEIPKITNNSRDWTITKLKFTVPFDTDTNKIKKIFKKIGQEMMEQPEYAAIMMQPFKSQGVYDVDDVGIVVRGKFMARPGTQYTLRKEIYNRVQKAFADAGIEFARKEVRVNIPGLDQADGVSAEQKSAIGAAAAEVAQRGEDNTARRDDGL